MKDLVQITTDLQLSYPPDQDWGICNGDASRCVEFLDYYEKHHADFEDVGTRHEMGDLIFASIDEAVRNRSEYASVAASCFNRFVNQYVFEQIEVLEYWRQYWTGPGRETLEAKSFASQIRTILEAHRGIK